MSKEYYYYDAKDGTEYPPHTCTDADGEERLNGSQLRYTVKNGGDVTTCSKQVLPIAALGSGYFDRQKHMNHV
jgi:hypothetical protein